MELEEFGPGGAGAKGRRGGGTKQPALFDPPEDSVIPVKTSTPSPTTKPTKKEAREEAERQATEQREANKDIIKKVWIVDTKQGKTYRGTAYLNDILDFLDDDDVTRLSVHVKRWWHRKHRHQVFLYDTRLILSYSCP